MSADRAILLLPYGHDPLAALAAHLATHHRHELPDLTRHTVLLPGAAGIRDFQRALLARAPALLPPTTVTLETWLALRIPTQAQLGVTQRELIFFDILGQFPHLKARYGGWALTEALLALFDELALNVCALPESIEAFYETLARGYGLGRTTRLIPLSDEARLVHSLYRAWHDFLRTQKQLDPAGTRLAAMNAVVAESAVGTHLYIAGITQWPRAMRDWLKRLPCSVTLLLQGETGASGDHPDTAVSALIEALDWPAVHPHEANTRTSFFRSVFALHGPALAERAAQARASTLTSPVAGGLTLYAAADTEHEARAVELQIRRWWLDGIRRCAVISNDRKLLRRVRALLERARLPVSDRSGWPLSTTSAASALNQWLDCLSHGFRHDALLDLMRSPFVPLGLPAEKRQTAVAVLERTLGSSHTGAGLDALERALARRADKVETVFGRSAIDSTLDILRRVRATAAPLLQQTEAHALSLAHAGRALVQSLEALGILQTYLDDEAGGQLLAVLDELIESAAAADAHGNWAEFNHWLHRALERRHFRLPLAGDGVELLGLHDAALAHYDALVLAGCTDDHLPGSIDPSPFFNDAVRRELGLPTSHETRNLTFNTFRRLLEAAEHVLITYRRHDAGRPVVVAPWVERLNAFHALAYDQPCTDPVLGSLLSDTQTSIAMRDAALPAVTPRPSPDIPVGLIPQHLTASSYQSLVDCPYQFYARSVLSLEPPRPLEEELTPADFGQLVHRCLQAFHDGVKELPGPWRGPLDAASLPEAQVLLDDIAAEVFAPHLRRTITTRAWLHRWHGVTTHYLAWQLVREQDWPASSSEQWREQALTVEAHVLNLIGRIDRIDRRGDTEAVIDYKTGKLPSREDIDAGEHVQLPFYRLLTPRATEAMLLGFADDGINDRVTFTGEALHDLARAHHARITALYAAIAHGARLPANGDPDTCDRCAVEILCRRQFWGAQDAHNCADKTH